MNKNQKIDTRPPVTGELFAKPETYEWRPGAPAYAGIKEL
jgi:hypothetical protein